MRTPAADAGTGESPPSRGVDRGRPMQDVVERRGSARAVLLRPEMGGLIAACVVFVFFAIFAGSKGFLSETGSADWLDTASQLGILALPVGLLMIAGEFDLSVGSVVGATSITIALCTGYYSLSPWIGVVLAIAIGMGIGFLNGIITVTTRLPSFIVTLAMMLMVEGGATGVANAIAGASSISAIPSGVSKELFASSWKSLDVSLLWWIGLAVAATYVLQRTRVGNWIMATGGDSRAARLSGVPTKGVKIWLFVVTSVGAVLVGIIETFSYSNGNVTLGSSYVFTAIAAAVIGGVLLTGGYGSTLGTVFGAITYGIASMGVFFLGWDTNLTDLFVGLFLLLAMLANNRLRFLALAGSEEALR